MPKVAVIQLSSSDNLSANLAASKRFLHQARDNGADLALLPENFAWMGKDSHADGVAEPFGNGPIQDFLTEISLDTGLWIIAGSIRLTTSISGKVSNSCLVFNPDGQQVARYDKIHLFDAVVANGEAYLESDTFIAGTELVVCDTPIGNVGLSICYDLRFPALFSALRKNGAKIISVPAAFTQTTGKAHWLPLLQARAIENQAYIIAAAQTGISANQRQTYGHAVIIDPWGTILQGAGTDPGVILANIDTELVDQIRQNMPVANHAKAAKFC